MWEKKQLFHISTVKPCRISKIAPLCGIRLFYIIGDERNRTVTRLCQRVQRYFLVNYHFAIDSRVHVVLKYSQQGKRG